MNGSDSECHNIMQIRPAFVCAQLSRDGTLGYVKLASRHFCHASKRVGCQGDSRPKPIPALAQSGIYGLGWQ